MACTNESCGNLATTGTPAQQLVETMSPVVEAGLPVIAITGGTPLGALDFLFNKTITQLDDGHRKVSYTFKQGLGTGSQIQYVRTNSDQQVERSESSTQKMSTTLVNTETAANSFDVTDVTRFRGIGKDSNILLYTGGKVETVTVFSVVGNTITLYPGQTITAPAETCLYRGQYSRGTACDAKIDNKYNLTVTTRYKANWRTISLSLEFYTAQLSLDRFVNYMGKNGTMDFINAHKQEAVNGFTEQFKYAFWFDRNLLNGYNLDGNLVDVSGSNQTMGLIPGLTDVQNKLGVNFFVNHGGCCAPSAGCSADIQQVDSFIDNIVMASESGMFKNGVITVVGNKTFLKNVTKMNGAFNEASGASVMYQAGDAGTSDTVFGRLPSITVGTLKVVFLYDDVLDIVSDTSFYITIPTDQVYLYQPAYAHLMSDTDIKATNDVNAKITVEGMPRLKFQDQTDFRTNRKGDCFIYDADFKFYIVFGALESGGYRGGINFGPCDAGCDICIPTARVSLV